MFSLVDLLSLSDWFCLISIELGAIIFFLAKIANKPKRPGDEENNDFL